MVRDGILYAVPLLLLAVLSAFLGGPAWAIPEVLLAAFVLYFFRDPDRTPPVGDWIISPADGRVVDVREMEWEGRRVWKISIFLSIFDVHVNRSPISGTIQSIQYSPGKFLVASRDRASVENEQNTVTIQGERCTVTFKQIAGLIARRIVFRKKIGDRVESGERVGLIKFGSRVDVLMPEAVRPSVQKGDRVRAGVSILAPANPSPDTPSRNGKFYNRAVGVSGER
jgi:phosphatidylserine decarboxylase